MNTLSDVFDLLRHCQTVIRQSGMRGDDYKLNHEARTLAIRYDQGDFDKARGLMRGFNLLWVADQLDNLADHPHVGSGDLAEYAAAIRRAVSTSA